MAWTTVNNRVLSDSDFSNMNVIRQLLYFKHNFADTTLYSKDEIDFILEWIFAEILSIIENQSIASLSL